MQGSARSDKLFYRYKLLFYRNISGTPKPCKALMQATPAVLSSPRLLRLLVPCCLALAALLPALTVYGLWTGRGGPVASLDGGLRLLLIALGLLPVLGLAYGLVRAAGCLRGMAHGQVFGRGTVGHLRGFAVGMFLSAVASLLIGPATGVALAWSAPVGPRSLSLQLDSQPLLMLLFAGIVWQVAHVMAHAAELAEEHAQIV